jgi:hypothetical protein
LALIADEGGAARVVRAARVGEGPSVGPLYLGRDASFFGASVRTVARHGNELALVNASDGKVQPFASFGDIGNRARRFGVSGDGNTVLAPGPYGVVCWQRQGGTWRERWAIDYWKRFDRLAWPVHDMDERNPEFEVVVPAGADYALVLFAEKYNQGWIKPDYPSTAWLQAVRLADGQTLWTFEVPVVKQLLFPTLHTSPGGRYVLLQIQIGSWGSETYRFYALADGKVAGQWSSGKGMAPLDVTLDDTTGAMALVYSGRLFEVRRADGTLLTNAIHPDQPVSVAFTAAGQTLYLTDDAGRLSRLDLDGKVLWQTVLGSVSTLAVTPSGPIAAGWDGRLRTFTHEGQPRWTFDCTPALELAEPLQQVAAAARANRLPLVAPTRRATTDAEVPAGRNVLADDQVKLTLGGTKSWMSDGSVQVKAEALRNGATDDVETPWLHLDEVFWDAGAGRQVWAEIEFPAPTAVKALTVSENPNHPDAWPTAAVVQVWNPDKQRWDTARFGVFLNGPVNTYQLDLEDVTKLRYVPWANYYRNFYTSELQVFQAPLVSHAPAAESQGRL